MVVSDTDVARWQAFGGTVQEAKGRKTYVAPSGKRLKTWKEAQHMLDHEDEDKEGVPLQPCVSVFHRFRHTGVYSQVWRILKLRSNVSPCLTHAQDLSGR